VPSVDNRVQRYRFGGWAFWLIALFPWLRAGEIPRGLVAGDPFHLGEAILNALLLLMSITLLIARFVQPAAELSPSILKVRSIPFLPSREFELSSIIKINWLSGSTLGLKLCSPGDVSVGLMLMAKTRRSELVKTLEERLSG